MHQSHPVNRGERGVAALPAILVAGAIVMEIAIAGALLAAYEANSGLGAKAGDQAFLLAQTGVEDGVMRVIMNKDQGYICYQLPVDSQNVQVEIQKDVPTTGQTSVWTKATVSSRTRRAKAILDVNGVTGKVDILSIEEVTSGGSCG
jgi:hypothetical protein